MLNNFSYLCCFVKDREKKKKLIQITINKVNEYLDALNIIKSIRYLEHVGDKTHTPFYEPKQFVSLNQKEDNVKENKSRESDYSQINSSTLIEDEINVSEIDPNNRTVTNADFYPKVPVKEKTQNYRIV